MRWCDHFSKEHCPTWEQVCQAVSSPLWEHFCQSVEQTYGVAPLLQHSCCSMAPGWNVKYRKGSKSLCTLYPEEGSFQCMVVIGPQEAPAADLLWQHWDPKLQELYRNTPPMRGSRWLMVPVDSSKLCEDLLGILALRALPKRRKNS